MLTAILYPRRFPRSVEEQRVSKSLVREGSYGETACTDASVASRVPEMRSSHHGQGYWCPRSTRSYLKRWRAVERKSKQGLQVGAAVQVSSGSESLCPNQRFKVAERLRCQFLRAEDS